MKPTFMQSVRGMFCAAAALAFLAGSISAAEPTPAEIGRFIADSRKATAERTAEIGILVSGLSGQPGAEPQTDILQSELRDYKRGKLLPAPLLIPLRTSAIGKVLTDVPVKLVEKTSDDEAVVQIHYQKPETKISRNSKGVSKVVTSTRYQPVKFVLKGVAISEKEPIQLPSYLYVQAEEANGTPAVIVAFDLADAEKHLPERNWFIKPRK
jgi:hypothetical protein